MSEKPPSSHDSSTTPSNSPLTYLPSHSAHSRYRFRNKNHASLRLNPPSTTMGYSRSVTLQSINPLLRTWRRYLPNSHRCKFTFLPRRSRQMARLREIIQRARCNDISGRQQIRYRWTWSEQERIVRICGKEQISVYWSVSKEWKQHPSAVPEDKREIDRE